MKTKSQKQKFQVQKDENQKSKTKIPVPKYENQKSKANHKIKFYTPIVALADLVLSWG